MHNASINLGLFMPSPSPFYKGLYISMKDAFEQLGFNVFGGCDFLEDQELKKFITKCDIQAIFEMNRCKSEINDFPSNVIHICWLVDLWGRSLEDLKGSDIFYFFSYEWMKDFEKKENTIVKWLPPASDPKIYYPTNQKKEYLTSFIGHIPKPWDKELKERVVFNLDKTKIKFRDILLKFKKQWSMQDEITNNDIYINDVINHYSKISKKNDLTINDKVLRYDIGCRIIRQGRRDFFLKWLLENESIHPFSIWGSENWKDYNRYSPFYQKELLTPKEMNTLFNQSTAVIHEGVGLHFRIFDAVLSQSLIILRKSSQDNMYGGIATMLDENIDYIAIDIDEKIPQLAKILNDKDKIKDITNRARKKVLKEHVWTKRLKNVQNDINTIQENKSG